MRLGNDKGEEGEVCSTLGGDSQHSKTASQNWPSFLVFLAVGFSVSVIFDCIILKAEFLTVKRYGGRALGVWFRSNYLGRGNISALLISY